MLGLELTPMGAAVRGVGAPGLTLPLDFTTGSLPVGVTYSGNGGTGTLIDSEGYLIASAADQPRFTYTPLRANAGVFVEPARTNLFLHSDALDNAVWAKSALTGVTANQDAGPTAAATLDKIIPNATSTAHSLSTAAKTVTAAQAWSMSAFARPAGYSFLGLSLHNGAITAGNEVIRQFNLGTGALGSTFNTAPTASGITEYIDSLWRVHIAWTISTTSLNPAVWAHSSNANPRTAWSGNTTSGVNVGAMQLEQASSPSSYIPTGAATVTRTADVLTVVGLPAGNYRATWGDDTTFDFAHAGGPYVVPTAAMRSIKTLAVAP